MDLKFPILVIASCLVIALGSCEKEQAGPRSSGYAKGVFISCEGLFQANNGSISWYDPDSAKIVNNLFELVNGRPAGDIIQSFALAGDYGVIVANNSNKIEIVNLETFESTGTITGFSYPRHFVYSGNGKGYLSNGSLNGDVYRIDLQAGIVTDTIEVGKGPEQMLISGSYLYVANSGGWDHDNTVSVIDTGTNKVVNTITVGDVPVALVADRNNDIWVLCRGKVVYNETWTEIIDETDSRLARISPASGNVDKVVVIGEKGDYFNPSWLAVDPSGNTLYYGEKDGLYSMDISEASQQAEPLIGKIFRAAGIHPRSGKLYALETADFSSPGKLHVYDDGGNLLSSVETGIAPGGLVFAGQDN
jgi:YVTN family beta-propeller protein